MSAPGSSEVDGTWKMVGADLNGEAAPELLLRRTTLELANGEYCVRFAGDVTDTGTFELGRNPAWKTMRLRGVEGLNAGRTIPCIYQLAGARLRICYGLDGVEPSEFRTQGANPRYLVSYRRRETEL